MENSKGLWYNVHESNEPCEKRLIRRCAYPKGMQAASYLTFFIGRKPVSEEIRRIFELNAAEYNSIIVRKNRERT